MFSLNGVAMAAAATAAALWIQMSMRNLHLSLSVTLCVTLYMIALYVVATFFFKMLALIDMLPSLRMHQFGAFLIIWASAVYQYYQPQPNFFIQVVEVVSVLSMSIYSIFVSFTVLRFGIELLHRFRRVVFVLAMYNLLMDVFFATDCKDDSAYLLAAGLPRRIRNPRQTFDWSKYRPDYTTEKAPMTVCSNVIDSVLYTIPLLLLLAVAVIVSGLYLLKLLQRSADDAIASKAIYIYKEREAEFDKILFNQPDSSHLGDCPICFGPLPLDEKKCEVVSCCSKMFCKSCFRLNMMRERKQRLKHRCPHCRELGPKTYEERREMFLKRAKVNDPAALRELGIMHREEGDYDIALEHSSRAAELGDAGAHFSLSMMYYMGKGVEKDEKRSIYHLEEAAIAGHPNARYNLGWHEWDNERYDRAVKHFIITANLGHDESLQMLKECYEDGHISKDEFDEALRAHQAVVEA